MKVGDVDQRDVADGLEAQQVSLAQLLLRKGACPSTLHDGRHGRSNFEELAARRHDGARRRRVGKAKRAHADFAERSGLTE